MISSLTKTSKPYYTFPAMNNTTLTPQASEAISYVITTAVESGFPSDGWFRFRKYKWKQIQHDDGSDSHYAEVEAKMDDECEAPWHDGKFVMLTPQVIADRMREILADPEAPVHTDEFWGNGKGYLAQEMRNLLIGDYGDGDSMRDDGILQVLFNKEVICS